MKTDNVIVDKSFDYSLEIVKLYKLLLTKNEYILSKQLVRSSTSIGANVEEATAGQTKKDFIAKMSIASKEARESRYWLRIFQESQLVEYDYNPHIKKADELIRILTSIVKTSQERPGG